MPFVVGVIVGFVIVPFAMREAKNLFLDSKGDDDACMTTVLQEEEHTEEGDDDEKGIFCHMTIPRCREACFHISLSP